MAIGTYPTFDVYRLDRSGKILLLTAAIAAADSTLAVTRAEMELSTTYDITSAMVNMNGFSITRESTQVPIWGTDTFPKSLSGFLQTEASSLEVYADKGGDDIRGILDPGDRIYLMVMPGGDVPADKCEVWKLDVNSLTNPKSGSAVATVVVGVDIQGANLRAAIPAAS